MRKGFTLIEVVVVIAIGAVILGMALSSHRKSRAYSELQLAGRELLADLEYTKSIAMKKASTAVLDFTAPPQGSAAGYSIKDSDGTVCKTVGFREEISANASPLGNSATFYANGSSAAAGTIVLSSAAVSKTVTLSINSTTGTITLTSAQ